VADIVTALKQVGQLVEIDRQRTEHSLFGVINRHVERLRTRLRDRRPVHSDGHAPIERGSRSPQFAAGDTLRSPGPNGRVTAGRLTGAGVARMVKRRAKAGGFAPELVRKPRFVAAGSSRRSAAEPGSAGGRTPNFSPERAARQGDRRLSSWVLTSAVAAPARWASRRRSSAHSGSRSASIALSVGAATVGRELSARAGRSNNSGGEPERSVTE